jgi:hypothetical protein
MPEIKVKTANALIEARSCEQLSSTMSSGSRKQLCQNTRVLNNLERESLYIEATKNLHDLDDEKCDDGDESERGGNNYERDFGKFSYHITDIDIFKDSSFNVFLVIRKT